MKAQSPLLGFNNNVKHRGRVFHIQTEDSGVRHPHVITHLFADGGRILKTTKTSYAEHIGAANMQEIVRGLMQEQHKSMFIALRDGQYDYLFDDKAPRPAPPSAPAQQPPPVAPPAAASPPSSGRAPTPPAQGATAAAAQKATAPARKITPRPRLDVDPRALQAQLTRSPSPLEVAAAHSPIDLDLSALERAADEAQTPFFQQLQPDLPPPPAAVLGRKPDGRSITLTSYRQGTAASAEAAPVAEALGVPPPPGSQPGRMRSPTAPVAPGRLPSSPGVGGPRLGTPGLGPSPRVPSSPAFGPPRAATAPLAPSPRQMAPTMPMPTRPGVGAPAQRPPLSTTDPAPQARAPVAAQGPAPRTSGGSGRYAPTRPAAIFTQKKPAESSSIFGDDLISEKSLDEVILSYLAEDLEGDKK